MPTVLHRCLVSFCHCRCQHCLAPVRIRGLEQHAMSLGTATMWERRKTRDEGGGVSTLKAGMSAAIVWRLRWCPLTGGSVEGCRSWQHCWTIWLRTVFCWCCESQNWWALTANKTARNKMTHRHRVDRASTVSSYKVNDKILYWFCLVMGSQCKDFNMEIIIFLSHCFDFCHFLPVRFGRSLPCGMCYWISPERAVSTINLHGRGGGGGHCDSACWGLGEKWVTFSTCSGQILVTELIWAVFPMSQLTVILLAVVEFATLIFASSSVMIWFNTSAWQRSTEQHVFPFLSAFSFGLFTLASKACTIASFTDLHVRFRIQVSSMPEVYLSYLESAKWWRSILFIQRSCIVHVTNNRHTWTRCQEFQVRSSPLGMTFAPPPPNRRGKEKGRDRERERECVQ